MDHGQTAGFDTATWFFPHGPICFPERPSPKLEEKMLDPFTRINPTNEAQNQINYVKILNFIIIYLIY